MVCIMRVLQFHVNKNTQNDFKNEKNFMSKAKKKQKQKKKQKKQSKKKLHKIVIKSTSKYIKQEKKHCFTLQ